jgi:hypothetical protein
MPATHAVKPTDALVFESVFEKPTRGSLSGEADGRAMIAKARIPPALTIAPMKGAASP